MARTPPARSKNCLLYTDLIHRFQDVIFGLLPPSRRGNNYCRPLPPASKFLHGANATRTIKELSIIHRSDTPFSGCDLRAPPPVAPRQQLRPTPTAGEQVPAWRERHPHDQRTVYYTQI